MPPEAARNDHLAQSLPAFGGCCKPFSCGRWCWASWERANAKGALSAMIVGGVLYAGNSRRLNIQYLVFHPIVPSLLRSLLAFLLGKPFRAPSASYRFD
ncbi:hypothetical protein ACNKHV_20555 [Shigella flexneri]